MNGFILQYDSFQQQYIKLDSIYTKNDICELLTIINNNYGTNLSDFIIVNSSFSANMQIRKTIQRHLELKIIPVVSVSRTEKYIIYVMDYIVK